jgi:predicted metal-binding membrane protein
VALLLALAAVAWWSTAHRMAGMDAGPGTDLGALGWFLGVWVVMMAAMMLPSLAPTAALYAWITGPRGWTRALLFTGGYLLVWGLAGAVAYGVYRLGRSVFGGDLAWHVSGKWFAGGALVIAALYELTPLKARCLANCRLPLESWRLGSFGALWSGSITGAWCVGCCVGLMVALFALGVMSLTWTALIAALIAAQKILPWRRATRRGTAALLATAAIALLAAPQDVPGLLIPNGAQHTTHSTKSMS